MAVSTTKTFFWANGYKRGRSLEPETYHAPRRFRSTPEYVPTKNEIYRMADSTASLRDRAIILTLFSSGLRNSTLRALLYQDVSAELEKGVVNIMLPVYPEMKKIDPDACKGGISYYSFVCDEATQSIKLYLKDRESRYGKVEGADPLFASEYNQIAKADRARKILSPRELQTIVKFTARRAGLAEWEAVHPHCLRKSYQTVMHTQLLDGTNLDVNVQEVFMGHVLPNSRDNYFDRSKVEWMRLQHSKLRFGRAVIENKFKVLELAVARAFEGTDIDPEKVLEEYIRSKGNGS
jgi:integrase